MSQIYLTIEFKFFKSVSLSNQNYIIKYTQKFFMNYNNKRIIT